MMSATPFSSSGKTAVVTTAVERLIGDAIGICATADPSLYRILCGILEIEAEPETVTAGDVAEPAEALAVVLRMLMYALIEEHAPGDVPMRASRLELCVKCVSERLELARVSRPSASLLRC